MRVRRKSEIELLRELLEEIFMSMEVNLTQLELECTTPTDALAASGTTRLKLWREKAEAAHYEPVPGPPARDELTELRRALKNICGMCCVWAGKPASELMSILADINWECVRSLKMENELQPAAPSVSEEQPARTYKVLGTEKNFSPRLETEERAPVRHRATIAMIPCEMSNRNCWHIEIDGVRPDGELGFCGTEAEAKAKMESLADTRQDAVTVSREDLERIEWLGAIYVSNGLITGYIYCQLAKIVRIPDTT